MEFGKSKGVKMAIISMIAAVDLKNGLGLNNQLLCYLPADLKYFKETTMGKPIIMGRKTFQSIGKPLPGRRNIVISRTLKSIEGVEIATSLDEAMSMTKDNIEVMIIGGGSIYQEAIQKADKIYLTIIQHHFTADVFFPNLDTNIWTCVSEKLHIKDEKNKFDIQFKEYVRIPS